MPTLAQRIVVREKEESYRIVRILFALELPQDASTFSLMKQDIARFIPS